MYKYFKLQNLPVEIQENTTLILTTRKNWEENGTCCKVYIDCNELPAQVSPGTDIYIDNGKIIINVSHVLGMI